MTDSVLLIGHGSVQDPSEIPEFVRSIRHGRPTPQSIVDEVTHRWQAIGGSPLQRIVEDLASKLEAKLGIPVAYGSRLWKPWAKDAAASLRARGATRILSLPLAPFSVHVYNAMAKDFCDVFAAPWGEEPALVDAFASAIREVMIPDAHVLFTAHSLPIRVVRAGDPYEGQVRAAAQRVASVLQLKSWSVAFQSQGMDGGEWLGPDLPTAFAEIARPSSGGAGAHAVVVCAIGFLADHTEVLYDLDVEARAIAERAGLKWARARSLNVHPLLIEALAEIAHRTL
ncbi:MAG: ferrochelatase [Polyangiales bacterium]